MGPDGVPALRERFVSLPVGIRLHVTESGPPDGQPVVLLHGWGASAYMWRFALRDLAAAGFRTIAPDLRGHGASDRPVSPGAYDSDTLIRDALSLIDALGVGRFAIAGQSMGGAIALHIAARCPDRVTHLALVNPAGLCHVASIRAVRLLGRTVVNLATRVPVPRWIVRKLLERCYGDPSRISAADVDAYWEPARRPGYTHAISALLTDFDWTPLSDAELASIRAPILLVVGTVDRVIPGGRAAASRLPNAHVVVVSGAGHTANSERPEEVNAALVEFLTRGEIA